MKPAESSGEGQPVRATASRPRAWRSRPHEGHPERGLVELLLDDLGWPWNEALSLELDAALAAEEAVE